jgi:hypothetical protein
MRGMADEEHGGRTRHEPPPEPPPQKQPVLPGFDGGRDGEPTPNDFFFIPQPKPRPPREPKPRPPREPKPRRRGMTPRRSR